MRKARSAPGYLFVLPWDLESVGGVSQVVDNLFSEFARGGRYRPYLLVLSWNDIRLREKDINGRHHLYYRLRTPCSHRQPVLAFARFILALPRQLFTLSRWLTAHDIAVINIHYLTADTFLLGLLKQLGLYKGKLVVSVHGADLRQTSQTRGVVRWCLRKILATADATVTCSESLARYAREQVPHLEMRVIHNGLDIERLLKEQSKDFRLPPHPRERRFILNVARFERKKGQDVLVRAFHSLAARYPDLTLVFVGAGGPEKNNIWNLICQLGLESRVFLYEDVPHSSICAFLESALIFALPSREEPFGIVLLEAGAMNVPVIATRVGGIPEIIVDRETGLLVRPDDADDLAAKITTLLENAELRGFLAKKFHATVVAKYTWKQAYNQYLSLVEGSSANRTRSRSTSAELASIATTRKPRAK